MKYLEIIRKRLAELAEARTAAIVEMEAVTAVAVTEARSALTVAEETQFAEVESRVASIDADITAGLAREAELVAIEARAAAAANIPQFVRPVDPVNVDEVSRMSRGSVRDAALRCLDEQPDWSVSTRNKDHVARLIDTRTKDFDGDHIARRLVLTETPAYRQAFVKAVTRSSPTFTPDEARAILAFEEFRAMSIGTDSAGGFGVPVLIDPTIIVTSGASDVPLLSVARIVTITTDEWRGVSSAGTAWSWDGEAGTVSDDSATLAQPSVVAHKGQGFIPYSIEVGMDYPGFAAEMGVLLEQGYMDLLAAATATGSGSSQPFGIFTALDANTNVEVIVTTDGAFGAVDIDKVWAALPERYRSRATWFMNVDVENEIRGFGSGSATSRFTVDQTRFGISLLNGRPVILSDYAPTFTGTTGASNILAVGDFSNFVIAQRAGMSVELIPHLFDVTNNRPTGSRGWFAWARVGSDSVNDNGFRLLQNQ